MSKVHTILYLLIGSLAIALVLLLILPPLWFVDSAPPIKIPPGKPHITFIPTPPEVVDRMLQMAELSEDDIVYDLGCGDGRIVLAAAERYGTTGVGVDIDAELVKKCRLEARQRGLEDRVTFQQADIFQLDISDATVVMLYLLPELNVRLVPQLQQLQPGSRIISHAFDIAGYEPDEVISVPSSDTDTGFVKIYKWIAPLNKNQPQRQLVRKDGKTSHSP